MQYTILDHYPDKILERDWQDFFTHASFGSGYTAPNFFNEPLWKDNNPFAVLAWDEADRIVGVVTGLRYRGRVICGLEVRPQLSIRRDADAHRVSELLAKALLENLGHNSSLMQVHSWEALEGFKKYGFSRKTSHGPGQVCLLDLTKGAEKLFTEFAQQKRSLLRKIMRENAIEVSQLETPEELAEFYEIHKSWCAGKGFTPDRWEVMECSRILRNDRRIFVAKRDGKIIAGSVFRMAEKGLVEYAVNNSDPDSLHFHPNDLIIWRSIQWACESGYTKYSMGGSHFYLCRFGGELVSTYRYQLDRSFLKRHTQKEWFYNRAIQTYQSIPHSARQAIKRVMRKS